MDPDELDDGRLKSVCPDCGTPYTRDDTTAACPECVPIRTRRPAHAHKGSARARGYTSSWDRLSLRARRLSPVCEDCGSTEDLTADHSPEAWKRHELGLVLRLRDVSVVCRRCNAERGAARGALAYQHDRWSSHRSTLGELVDEYDRDEDEPDSFT